MGAATDKSAKSGCLATPIIIAAIILFALIGWIIKTSMLIVLVPLMLGLSLYAYKSSAPLLLKIVLICFFFGLAYWLVSGFIDKPGESYHTWMKT